MLWRAVEEWLRNIPVSPDLPSVLRQLVSLTPPPQPGISSVRRGPFSHRLFWRISLLLEKQTLFPFVCSLHIHLFYFSVRFWRSASLCFSSSPRPSFARLSSPSPPLFPLLHLLNHLWLDPGYHHLHVIVPFISHYIFFFKKIFDFL